MYSSLITLAQALENKTIFTSSKMNLLNRINEAFVLFSSYFLISFTEILDASETRIKIGYFYIYSILSVIIFNVITLITHVVYKFYKKLRIQKALYKYKIFIKS